MTNIDETIKDEIEHLSQEEEIFELEDVNKALKKVESGGSKGKTLIKIM